MSDGSQHAYHSYPHLHCYFFLSSSSFSGLQVPSPPFPPPLCRFELNMASYNVKGDCSGQIDTLLIPFPAALSSSFSAMSLLPAKYALALISVSSKLSLSHTWFCPTLYGLAFSALIYPSPFFNCSLTSSPRCPKHVGVILLSSLSLSPMCIVLVGLGLVHNIRVQCPPLFWEHMRIGIAVIMSAIMIVWSLFRLLTLIQDVTVLQLSWASKHGRVSAIYNPNVHSDAQTIYEKHHFVP